MTVDVRHGDSLAVLRTLPDASIDSCVCDPPYGLGTREPTVDEIVAYLRGESLDTGGDFMGRAWEIPSVALWREVFRVLKPGGHVLAFAGTRTVDLVALGLRAAGGEFRDSLQWLYGQGFPKSRNLDGDWNGWGTALKPAHEPILMFRKPLDGTVARNVLAHGTGALNIDGCRIGATKRVPGSLSNVTGLAGFGERPGRSGPKETDTGHDPNVGRWPANVILSHLPECREVGTRKVARNVVIANNGPRNSVNCYGDGMSARSTSGVAETVPAWECADGCPVAMLDAQSGTLHSHGGGSSRTLGFGGGDAVRAIERGDTGGASRFFYCAKASTRERSAGLPDGMRNDWPTVKPVAVMEWLVRLVTPPGGIVLDLFAGSGTTGVAAARQGFRALLIDRDEHAVELSRARVAAALDPLARGAA